VEHPARQVIDLTPRVWKDKLSGHPIGSAQSNRHLFAHAAHGG